MLWSQETYPPFIREYSEYLVLYIWKHKSLRHKYNLPLILKPFIFLIKKLLLKDKAKIFLLDVCVCARMCVCSVCGGGWCVRVSVCVAQCACVSLMEGKKIAQCWLKHMALFWRQSCGSTTMYRTLKIGFQVSLPWAWLEGRTITQGFYEHS